MEYLFFLFLVSILATKVKNKKYTVYDLLILVILIAFSGLRYGIGTDYKLYEEIYKNNYNVFRTGKGFYLIINSFRIISEKSPCLFYFAISCVTNICIYNFLKKESSNFSMSLLLYICLGFYIDSFNIFRQMLALAIVLQGKLFMDNKKYILMSFMFIISTVIHSTAILLILVIIATKFLKIRFNYKIILLLSIFVFLFYNEFYNFLVENISSLSIYKNETDYKAGLGTLIRVLINFTLSIIIILNKRKLLNNNKNTENYIEIYLLGSIISVFSLKNILFSRIAQYFLIFILLIIPELYKVIRVKDNKYCKFVFYSALVIYFCVYIVSFNDVFPYNCIIYEKLK